MSILDLLMGTPEETNNGDAVIQKNDETTFPVVQIKNVKTYVNGDKLQVYCLIENSWSGLVTVDKITIFDTTRQLDTILSAGQARDFLVYDGTVLRKEHNDVVLQYKTQETGDYFATEHTAKFTYRSQDDTYEVGEIRLNEPVRDIYG